MKSVTGKEFAKVLERNGWLLLQVRGSHHLYFKAGVGKVALPIHGSKDLRVGTLNQLMKRAGLTEKDL
jgi:predicted RNA binding protein YcfA (HicA-like mRNA interferase family)